MERVRQPIAADGRARRAQSEGERLAAEQTAEGMVVATRCAEAVAAERLDGEQLLDGRHGRHGGRR